PYGASCAVRTPPATLRPSAGSRRRGSQTSLSTRSAATRRDSSASTRTECCPSCPDMEHDLGHYRLLSDGRCTALVGPERSVPWFCAPRFDSTPVLGRLLDAHGAGAWIEGGQRRSQPVGLRPVARPPSDIAPCRRSHGSWPPTSSTPPPAPVWPIPARVSTWPSSPVWTP